MTWLKVMITAQSPLCFSERRPGGQFRPSTEYVPGSVLRGAAAAILLRDGKEQDAEFQQLFGIGQAPLARFCSAYPGDQVLPHTALSCKDHPGFGNTDDNHGVFDSLINRLCFEQLQPPGILYLPHCPREDCDPGRAESFSGYYIVDEEQYTTLRIPQRLLTRVGINRRRMAAEDNLLYTPMVLSEAWWRDERLIMRANFTGWVWVENALADLLSGTLNRISHLGSGTARGLGQVQTICHPEERFPNEQAPPAGAIECRVNNFNDVLRQTWEQVEKLGSDSPMPCPLVFTVNLRSDAILKEHGWLPTTVLTEAILQESTGVEDESLTLLRSYASYDYRGGWNTGQRMPKDTELVTRSGSVFVFQIQDYQPWKEPLAELEINGIGERTAEGFGDVTICDPFHVTGREAR